MTATTAMTVMSVTAATASTVMTVTAAITITVMSVISVTVSWRIFGAISGGSLRAGVV
jgi:hypothetical protein